MQVAHYDAIAGVEGYKQLFLRVPGSKKKVRVSQKRFNRNKTRDFLF